ncbi:hypothetical protein N9K16_00315 [Alphaproteobacteria bacterium]|nr:hypothetical protein [Alphaproteobacteria bacterium]
MFTKVISWAHAAKDGDLWVSMHRLRQQEFIERLAYDVCSDDGLEYDQYDTPAARYVVAYNNRRRVLGTIRLLPTLKPFMLKDLWPELLPADFQPSTEEWEASRIVVNSAEKLSTRNETILRLLLEAQHFGIENNIQNYLGVMYPAIWKAAIVKNGCTAVKIAQTMDGERVLESSHVPISRSIYHCVNARLQGQLGITHPNKIRDSRPNNQKHTYVFPPNAPQASKAEAIVLTS